MENSAQEVAISIQLLAIIKDESQQHWRACDAAFEAWENILPASEASDIEYSDMSEEHQQLHIRNQNAWNLLHLAQSKLDPTAWDLPQPMVSHTPLYFLSDHHTKTNNFIESAATPGTVPLETSATPVPIKTAATPSSPN